MASEVSKSNTEGKGKGGKKALIICIIIIAVLAGAVIYFLLSKEDKGKRNVVVNEDNLEEIIAQMEEVENRIFLFRRVTGR